MRTARSRARGSDSVAIAAAVAVALHAAVIGLVHFEFLGRKPDSVPSSLDVVLVEFATEQAPEEADFLAQATQRGGGTAEEVDRPAEPMATSRTEEVAPVEQEATDSASRDQPEQVDEVVQVESDEPAMPVREETELDPDVSVSTSEIIEQTRSMARASTERLSDAADYPERPRRKFVSANTREHLYAGYMRSWVSKVERVGNLNYPERARRQNLAGALVLSVDILEDGSVARIRVLRSSGHDVLDEAAVRIVRLSSPFAPLPEEIRREVDVLTITRTWQFSSSGVLRGG
ncbi:energy transducer TonB [Wenzhouxiangella sediminis]|uniref:Energy transducer TonB n=1 Tax=Wenzhouxiangella sediminis TaxID=1792836 RepID=A0A3E1KDI6_9GAMM|nr:energy transducer TonB [Wenzhouxiangella sediminis]RFF32505.1 energy transducer TonB [Wenzhouxiangella sediminis]